MREAISWIDLSRSDESLPVHLRVSLTLDQGAEMARRAAIVLDAALSAYFGRAHRRGNAGTAGKSTDDPGIPPKSIEIPGNMEYR